MIKGSQQALKRLVLQTTKEASTTRRLFSSNSQPLNHNSSVSKDVASVPMKTTISSASLSNVKLADLSSIAAANGEHGDTVVPSRMSIQTSIKQSTAQENYAAVVDAFLEALRTDVKLDSEAHNLVLTACARLRPTAKVATAVEAAYDFFTQGKAMPLEVFYKVVQYCLNAEDPIMAIEVNRTFNKRYRQIKGKEKVLYPVALTLARYVTLHQGGGQSDERRDQAQQMLGHIIGDIVPLSRSGCTPPSEELFVEMARAFSLMAQSENLLTTLVEMTAAKHEPSLALCEELLEQALWNSDRKVLQVLLGWFVDNFREVVVDLGRVNRVLHIAAYRGDEAIARLGFKLLERRGGTPEMEHYVCWTRACLQSHNINGAMEALLEAQVNGLDPLKSVHGLSLQTLLADTFKSTTNMLDGIYFSLVDLRRGSYQVPRVVLNAVIHAAGKLNQLDRAFCTFQEYQSLFGHKPDVHTFNALLAAIAASRYPTVESSLAVLEDMETCNVLPSDESFSVLLATMAETGEMKAYDDIMAYMEQLSRLPSAAAVRKVVLRLAKDGQTKRLAAALELLERVSGGRSAPKFLTKRIDTILAAAERSASSSNTSGATGEVPNSSSDQ